MGRVKQEHIARKYGPQYTLYAVSKALGIPPGVGQTSQKGINSSVYQPLSLAVG